MSFNVEKSTCYAAAIRNFNKIHGQTGNYGERCKNVIISGLPVIFMQVSNGGEND